MGDEQDARENCSVIISCDNRLLELGVIGIVGRCDATCRPLAMRFAPKYLYPAYFNGDGVRAVIFYLLPMFHYCGVDREVKILVSGTFQMSNHTKDRMRRRKIYDWDKGAVGFCTYAFRKSDRVVGAVFVLPGAPGFYYRIAFFWYKGGLFKGFVLYHTGSTFCAKYLSTMGGVTGHRRVYNEGRGDSRLIRNGHYGPVFVITFRGRRGPITFYGANFNGGVDSSVTVLFCVDRERSIFFAFCVAPCRYSFVKQVFNCFVSGVVAGVRVIKVFGHWFF